MKVRFVATALLCFLVGSYGLAQTSNATLGGTVSDASGAVLSELTGPAEAGLNRAMWAMRAGSPGGRRGGAGGGGAPGGTAGGASQNAAPAGPLPAGDYQIKIEVAGQTFIKVGTIRNRIGG